MNLLKPIEFILKNIFDFSFTITGNYGISLILMSIIVTIGTYPLYYLADIWKKKEDNIQTEMKKEIDEIKRAFQGQKRFYLIQATYRFHNYKSLFALRAAIGLLIQIPFFFAAFNMLSSYQNYAGYSFLFIQDLSKPDSLIYGLNFLPILMTAINIISSLVYTRSLSFKDNKQLFILSLVFFVFLYNSPAALLIYWTNNNILSLLKSYFLNKNKKIVKLSKSEIKITLLISTLCLFYFIFIIGLFIINKFENLTKYVFLFNFFITSLVYIYTYIIHTKYNIKKIYDFFLNLICIFVRKNYIVLIAFSIFLFKYFFKPEIKFINLTKIEFLGIQICFLLFQLNSITDFFNWQSEILNKLKKSLLLSYSFFIFLISFVIPLQYYLKAPEEAGCNTITLFLINLSIFLIFYLISYFNIKKGKKLSTIIGIFIIVISTINILFPLDVGFISGFELSLNNNIKNVSFENLCKDLFIGFISILLSYYFFKNIKLLKLLPITLIVVSSFQITLLIKNTDTSIFKTSQTDVKLPQEYYNMHSLAKDKTNILYICLDMFNSEYIQRIYNEDPNFREYFKGFTYYKDTLSISGWTSTSFRGSLYYGNKYSPLNNNKNGINIVDSGKEAINNLKTLLRINNFDYAFINDNVLGEVSVEAERDFSTFAQYWCKKNNIKLKSINKVPWYQMFSLFQFIPTLCKYYIYNNSNWIVYGEPYMITWNRDNAIKTLSYLDLLPELSSTNSEKSKFLFFRTELSHQPFGINKDGQLISDSYPDEINKSFYSSDAAYYSAKKTIELLLNYFEWMKKNGCWDNSIIVLFSDHGNNCFDNNIPIIDENNEDEKLYKSRSNALYLIKPLNSQHDFVIDTETLKSNGDILYDVFNLLNINNDIEPCTQNGIRYYSFMKNFDDYRNHKQFIDYANYKVTGSIFKKESWVEIQ